MWKPAFKTFYLVHSWILSPKYIVMALQKSAVVTIFLLKFFIVWKIRLRKKWCWVRYAPSSVPLTTLTWTAKLFVQISDVEELVYGSKRSQKTRDFVTVLGECSNAICIAASQKFISWYFPGIIYSIKIENNMEIAFALNEILKAP